MVVIIVPVLVLIIVVLDKSMKKAIVGLVEGLL